MFKKFLFLDFVPASRDAGLLLWRIGFGGMLAILHGLPKLMKFSSMMDSFPDPLGMGSPVSYWCTVGAEALAALFIVMGLCTRWAALGVAFTMAVAFVMVHKGSLEEGELALAYMFGTLPLLFAGAGRFSADAKWGSTQMG
jgi:putative oxidoreductase